MSAAQCLDIRCDLYPHDIMCPYCGQAVTMRLGSLEGMPSQTEIPDQGIFNHGGHRYSCSNDSLHSGRAFICASCSEERPIEARALVPIPTPTEPEGIGFAAAIEAAKTSDFRFRQICIRCFKKEGGPGAVVRCSK